VTIANAGANASAFVSTTAPDKFELVVAAPSSAPLSTTVTVSWNGTVIATRSLTFTGAVAKVTLSSPSIGVLTGTGTATLAFADSAGNAVYPTSGGSAYPSAGISTDGTTLNLFVTAGTVATLPSATATGKYNFSCAATAGSAAIVVKYANPDGSVVKSAPLTVNCAGAADTYTAKLDKSSYAPGELATLTVTFKDSKGNLANDALSTNANASDIATTKPQVSGGYLTPTTGDNTTQGGTAGTTSDGLTSGVITYKFVVGAPTIDPYSGQLLVSFPTVNTDMDGANQTVAYTIKTGQTSLNDVLKGIVSLIASINKQIAALAKLVTKKK